MTGTDPQKKILGAAPNLDKIWEMSGCESMLFVDAVNALKWNDRYDGE